MTGEIDLDRLLLFMQPTLISGEFVFCTVPDGRLEELSSLKPLACYHEEEGLSLILLKETADEIKLSYNSVFRGITLSVHSSLDAVGFTAAVSNKLASNGVSANVVAAHFHDHIFVPAVKAEYAMELLTNFQE
ncbi:MAG: ACT domain-containing protein [Gammaproteobacteria bacterium]|jgi:hypothetical protein|nr:ACT domain-containing protein [Gammaproteobacteria bacterium]MBT3860655.1 ACT domain-containing protein [Gammaproteobacteria bacterium]MBT3988792.1 ACT domain-containing protein [Gammaproteobacteria bacterium]MBT4255178.1 ACT domain-containing protein [Gammaproteobacteria bacterium]MBT4582655.1 ACT domain-containing protein [Gammaproteobacteria bacterium]